MAERTEHLEAVLLSAVRPSQEQEKRFLAFLAEKYGEGTTLTRQKSDDYPDGFRPRWARRSTTGARADA